MLPTTSLLSFTDQLYQQMENELEVNETVLLSQLQNLSGSLSIIQRAMDQLKVFILAYSFDSDAEEIHFFKYIKPRFYCWLIYYTQQFSIFAAVPKGPDLIIRDYYLQELNFVQRHFNQNPFVYQYYLMDEDSKDALYFLRIHLRESVPLNLHLIDDDFSTGQDYAFAKFRAYEMLQEELIKRLRLLYQYPDTSIMPTFLGNKDHQWTGDKINLIELAYGIYYMGQMNDGKAEIGDVVSWLEESLHIDLGRAYRKFIDIRRRKTISYTHFLDQMRESIQLRISESDRYKPKSFSRNSGK